MKLHLPKMLVTALIAASVTPAFAVGKWAADGKTNGHALYYSQDAETESIETLTLPNGSNGISVQNPSYVSDSYANIGIVAGRNGEVVSINTAIASDGQTLMIMTNPWGTSNALTANILTLKYADGENLGSGKLQVDANHTANVSTVVGTLDKVTNNGALSLGTEGGNINMAGSIVNNGSLKLYGTLTYDLSNASAFEAISRSYSQSTPGTNGYADSVTSQYYALKSDNVVSGEVTFEGFDAEGVSAADWLGNNYVFTMSGAADHVYLANTGTTDNAAEVDAKRFVVASNATLSITTNGSAVIEGSGTVSVTKVASTTRVTGDSMRGLTLDADNWTGWVSLTGTGGSGTGFSTLGSNIEIGANGYEGWDSEKWNGTSAQNYRLTGNWKNGAMSSNTSPTGTFSGTWTGAGNFTVDIADAKTMNYTYSGNIAGWTGNFIGGAGTTLLTLSGNATTMNAAVESGTGTLNMKIATGSLTTLNGAITVKDLTLAQSSAFNEALTVKGNISQNGQHSLRIFNAADITGSVNMTNMSTFTNKTVTLRGGATIGTTMYIGGANADVKFTGDEKTYSFQNLSTSYLTATGAESGTDAVDRKVTVGAGATVNISQNINMGWGLTKVELEDGATLMAGGAINYGSSATNCISSVVMGADSTFQVGSTHNGTVKTNSLTLNGNATLNANLVMNSGTLSITAGNTLTMGCSVTIGDTVEVHISGADAEAIRHGSELTIINLGHLATTDAITLGSASIYIDDVEQNDFSLMRVDNGDGTSRIVVAPEPATATLSLLALAALAARRKRH